MGLRRAAALATLLCFAAAPAFAAPLRVAFIPMDDRPATARFPQQTAAICGAQLEMPPPQLLGHFTRPGDADAIGQWLLALDTQGLSAVVVSSDMLAYGGLVASRTPATPLAVAHARVATLVRFHEMHPGLPVYVFGTIMRLAPTETPQSEPYLEALTNYARLAGKGHLTPDDRAALAQSRGGVPDAAFFDYIGARVRNVAIDEQLVTLSAQRNIAWLALTQDDAGSPDGLQAGEQRRLQSWIYKMKMGDRVVVNPGADEMGMVAVTRAIEDAAGWAPHARVVYSAPAGTAVQDPLEDTTVGQTIGNLLGALRINANGPAVPDFTLYVFTPLTSFEMRDRFFDMVADRLRHGEPAAIADLTFIDDNLDEERVAVEALRAQGVAALPMAFASWNTTANTAGTALSAAACAALAHHVGNASPDAQATFLFDRYVDDYGYRLLVRPMLNEELRRDGVDTYALADQTAFAESLVRARLWPLALDLFDTGFAPAGWKQSRLSMYLPWGRTFEVQLDTTLTRQ